MESSDLEEFLIKYPKERERYIRTAYEQHLAATIFLFEGSDRVKFTKFNSKIFWGNNDQPEVELFLGDFNIRTIDDCEFVGIFFIDGVKYVFESDINFWKKISDGIVNVNLTYPKKMIRYQRRNNFRVKVPHNINFRIDLNRDQKNLSKLYVVDVSAGGAAILINANEDFFREFNLFENVYLLLPNSSQEFKVKAKICHKKTITKEFLPKDLAKFTPTLADSNWYQVGIQFDHLPIQVEQALMLLVNQLSRIEKN